LGLDTIIQFGQHYLIPAISNADTSKLMNLVWTPDGVLHCPSCFQVIAKPEKTTRFHLKITDQYGCEAEDDILIEVLVNSDLYIPNVFSPNKDQINDFFSLFSVKEVVNVKSLRIFDRWGDMVYLKENFLVNGQLPVWDGTQNGKELMTGVYVYVVEVEAPDKKHIFKKGDLTLIR